MPTIHSLSNIALDQFQGNIAQKYDASSFVSLSNVIYSLCRCYLLSSSDVGEGYSIPVGKGKLGRWWSPYSFTETSVGDWFKANANVGPT